MKELVLFFNDEDIEIDRIVEFDSHLGHYAVHLDNYVIYVNSSDLVYYVTRSIYIALNVAVDNLDDIEYIDTRHENSIHIKDKDNVEQ